MRPGPFDSILRHIRGIALSASAARQEDAELLERFLTQRDEAAFEALVRRHGPMVLGVCRRLLADPRDAEDAFQATFLVLLRKAGSLGRRELLAKWLYGVAYRVALKARTGAARRRAHERQAVPPPADSPADDAAWRDLRPVLDAELARLPEKYRLPVVLCYLEGRTFTEAAELLGWPAGTVSGRVARARELLRKRLTRRGVALSVGVLAGVMAKEGLAAVPAPLVVSTVKAAAYTAGQAPGAGGISPAVAALTEGVLRAMFLKKLTTVAAVVLVLGALSAAGVLTYPTLAARQNDSKEAEPAPAAKPETRLQALLKERVDAARAELEVRKKEFEAGRVLVRDQLAAARRLVEAQEDMSGKKEDLLAALETYVQMTKQAEQESKVLSDAGRISPAEVAEATYYRAEAEIWLERAKAK